MEKQLFTLLRLGLGTTTFEDENISEFLVLSVSQWTQLEEMARVQGVSAIALDGVKVIMDKLGDGCFTRSVSRDFWREFILNWAFGIVEQGYEAGNMRQLIVVDKIQKLWAEAGIRMMLMKGQAIGCYYPIPKHRCPGDIDCYLFEDYSKGNELAKSWADSVDENWYKHSVIAYGGQTIENHQFFVHTREGKVSKELNQTLCETLCVDSMDKLQGTDVLLPSPMFNALFLTYHALSHFLEEGLRIKQLLDWAMFLQHDANRVEWGLFYEWCDKYHLRQFANIANDIAVHYIGIKIDNSQVVATSPNTERVIKSTLNDNDYVFNSGQSKWSNRWHIISNLFRYRWKYHLIYQHSILRQLWFYLKGFILMTQ